MNYYIKDREWEIIFTNLRQIKGIHTQNEIIIRRFIEAVWYITRTGCQWRLLPDCYGHWRAIHMRFKHWSDKNIWDKLFDSCKDGADMESIMIDSTIVRAHACSSGYQKDSASAEALGRSKGGFSTKIHTLVDALGNPLKFILTPGQRNDIIQSGALLDGLFNTTVIADKGYDANLLLDIIAAQDSIAVIPPKQNRKVQRDYDEHLYKERYLIECFFGKIKHFRRVFSRFDKTASAFMGFLHFVGVLIWLR